MQKLQPTQLTGMTRVPMRRMITPCVSLVLLVMVGCRDRAAQSSAVDSLLSRDLTLAAGDAPNRPIPAVGDTAIATPTTPRATAPQAIAPPVRPASRPSRTPLPLREPTVSAPAPAPSAEQPIAAPTPAPAPNPSRALAAGTSLSGKTNAAICSLANRPGDRIVAALAAPVSAPDGAVLPAGTPILVEMAPPTADGRFEFRVRSVQVNGELVPVQGTVRVGDDVAVTERQVSKGGDKGKVISGALIGAIAGRVLGGGTRGAVIGAAGGAAAGTIAAARNSQTEQCLPPGAVLTVTLSAPLVLP